jgi:hypothetical protein
MSSPSLTAASAALLITITPFAAAHAEAPENCAPATSGTLTAANTAANPLAYAPDGPFALTIDLPEQYRATHRDEYIQFTFYGASEGGESILAGDATGDFFDPVTHWAAGRPFAEGIDHAYMIPSGGPKEAQVETVAGTTCVTIALTQVPDDPGDPSLPFAATGMGPRFAIHTPRYFPGLGLQFSEPTMGVNPATGAVFTISTLDVLRTTFDDSTTPARDHWVSRPALESTFASLDPILTVDPDTGRVFSLNLAGPISSADFSDDDGETWLPGGNGFPTSGVDHQSLEAGPYPSSGVGALIPHPLYPNAVYYCSQGVADAYCSRSDDGGVTFRPAVVTYTNTQCTGLHGHVKVGPDGTVYVPNKACGVDFPTFGNGHPGLIVSEDAGLTWTIHQVSEDVTNASSHHGDPSVAIGRDNVVYFSYIGADGHLKTATSMDHGATWTHNFDVGAIAGVHAAQFPAVVAGDAGRAAVAFLGTAFPDVPRAQIGIGPLPLQDSAEGNNDFPGNWYGYIATTYDFGAHWHVTKVAPEDILQGPAGIGGGGDNRNLLDFNDAYVDQEGRILAAFADGCIGGCQLGYQGNSYSNARIAQIARQSGGKRMYAEFDPVEPAAPPAPRASGYRTRDYVVLTIDADHGGSPITGYDIFRNGTQIAASYPATTYVDLAANDASATYRYKVSAVNALGASPQGNDFVAVVGENAPVTEAVCSLPGQLWLDQVNEPGAEVPSMDLVSMGIAEPADQPGKLVFTVQARAGGGGMRLGFDHPNGRRYNILITPDGTDVGYTDGRYFASTQATQNNIMYLRTDAPALDSSGVDTAGTYTAVLDKAAWELETGELLRNVTAFGLLPSGGGQVFLRDFLGYDVSQPIVGNDFCEKGAHLPPPVVDVPLPPSPPPPTTGTVSQKRFGGSLGWLTLALLALGLQARRALERFELP